MEVFMPKPYASKVRGWQCHRHFLASCIACPPARECVVPPSRWIPTAGALDSYERERRGLALLWSDFLSRQSLLNGSLETRPAAE